MPPGAQPGAGEPAPWKLLLAIRHVPPAEDADAASLSASDRREPRREVPADRLGTPVDVAALHPIGDDDLLPHRVTPGSATSARPDAAADRPGQLPIVGHSVASPLRSILRRLARRAISSRRPLNIHSCTGRRTYQYARPSRPRGSNVAVWRRSDRRPSSSGVTLNASQPRPGNFRSALSRRCRSGSYASTVQPSMICQPAVLGIAAAAAHAHAAEPEVQPASRSPEGVPEVPAVRAANPPDRRKDLRRRRVQNRGPRVDLLTQPSAALNRLRQRHAQRRRFDLERVECRRRSDHRRVLQPFHQRAADTGLDGVTSASQRPDRCGVNNGTGSSQRRSPRSWALRPHDVAVRDDVWTADLEHVTRGVRPFQGHR